MGNCIDVQKPILWVDDDDWETPEPESPVHCREQEKAERAATGRSAEPPPAKEKQAAVGSSEIKIKIKISKKQMEELLRQVDEKGLSIERVLADLVVIGEVCLGSRDGHWRPNLQSIPEVSE
ncbi:hypothetical protein MUK42_04311 [Musa troglodytarum]|uniref:Uncharacterized protein n=1 Tax=Musa troglodytarum TaxID=320322 RepID=A0A9E7GHP0_9LILI|nr:hypothetical protein MUK42_04311 [Musa troglodytarum]